MVTHSQSITNQMQRFTISCWLYSENTLAVHGRMNVKLMATHLTTIVFLFHHPEDGRPTGRNMLNIL